VTTIYRPGNFRYICAGTDKDFQGVISGNGFILNRIIRYVNSFLPIIHGTFESVPRGTAVHVRLKLHPVAAGSMVVVVAIAAWGAAKAFREGWPSPYFTLVPCIFLAVL
jgi:hypothetical protein